MSDADRRDQTNKTTTKNSQIMRNFLTHSVCLCAAAGLLIFAAGCQTGNQTTAPAATAAPTVAPAPSTPSVAQAAKIIRIKTGVTDGFTDKNGNAWMPDQGFADGETIERPDATIANASDPKLYQAERYSMTKFAQALPNGKYTVKLHFCETFDVASRVRDSGFFLSTCRGMSSRILMFGPRLAGR